MKPRYVIRRSEDIKQVKALHTLCFPQDDWENSTAHWIAWDSTGSPVGFCSARKSRHEPVVILTRAGVLPCANGAGLQRRMIQVRLRWARQVGAEHAITYTVYDNHPSIVNLLRSGFLFYEPAEQWAGAHVNYFWRSL